MTKENEKFEESQELEKKNEPVRIELDSSKEATNLIRSISNGIVEIGKIAKEYLKNQRQKEENGYDLNIEQMQLFERIDIRNRRDQFLKFGAALLAVMLFFFSGQHENTFWVAVLFYLLNMLNGGNSPQLPKGFMGGGNIKLPEKKKD